MADDREQELKRLEKELLADIADNDDLLSDLPIELLDERPLSWAEDADLLEDAVILEAPAEEEVPAERELSVEEEFPMDEFPVEEGFSLTDEVPAETETQDGELMSNNKKKATKKTKADQKREDRWLITLMIIASFLCVGIIGVLIYWLEVFLK